MSNSTSGAKHTAGLILEASRHQVAVVNYCEQARVDAEIGKRHMAFWCLEMAARHRAHYVTARAAIAKAQGGAS